MQQPPRPINIPNKVPIIGPFVNAILSFSTLDVRRTSVSFSLDWTLAARRCSCETSNLKGLKSCKLQKKRL
jgi:hypothetical protein